MLHRYDYSFKSLGTTCSITVVHENDTGLDTIVQTACAQIMKHEERFSRFRSDSMLSVLNRDKRMLVDNDFIDLFRCSKRIYALTQGYFNPLSDIRTLGYITNFEDTHHFSLQDIPEDLDMDQIHISENEVTLRPSMNLDFGAIAKGYIADRIGLYLEKKGYSNFIVNLGGDTVIRWVTKNNTIPTVGILSPTLSGFAASIAIKNASVSTSGSYVRNWKIGSDEFHHIKTPKQTTQNADLWSVTIVADYGYESDALATAVFAMGYEKGLHFCEENTISALWIHKDGSIHYTPGFDTKYPLQIQQ